MSRKRKMRKVGERNEDEERRGDIIWVKENHGLD